MDIYNNRYNKVNFKNNQLNLTNRLFCLQDILFIQNKTMKNIFKKLKTILVIVQKYMKYRMILQVNKVVI